MRCIILSVGTELTCGQTVDTNSAFMARGLAERGIEAIEHVTVPDDLPAISRAIRAAADRAELVIISGGLGPTEDDLTRAALAEAMGTTLETDAACLAEIEAFFRSRGYKMNEVNRRQALVPRGAKPLPNPVGTLPQHPPFPA